MTEAFYIVAVLASLTAAVRLAEDPSWRAATALGVATGVAVLLRQPYLLFFPGLASWTVAAARRGRRRAALLGTGAAAAVVVAAILPFTIWNYIRFERFVLLNNSTGFAFFWANHPIHGTDFYDILPPELGSYQDLIPVEIRNLDEAALDQELLRRGLVFVAADPARYALLSLSRIPDYFKWWPEPASGRASNALRTLSFGVVLPFIILGIWQVSRGRMPSADPPSRSRPVVALLLIFAVVYTTIHLASWALIRYRLPVDAVLIPFAGAALADVAAYVRRLTTHGQSAGLPA
jgi:4-amino-4-deoxy-L-arabinose transferase-like glycosyltransferase